jgi:hypothetical protein
LTSEYNTSNRPATDDYNGWADFWRNSIGVNVIPANTAEKNGVHGKTNPYHRNYTTLGSTIISSTMDWQLFQARCGTGLISSVSF